MLFRSEILHVPYQGSAKANMDLMGNSISMVFDSMPGAWPLVEGKKLRAIAVSSKERNTIAPSVPTVAEAGVPGFEAMTWYGYMAPAKTPPDIVNKMHKAMADALQDPAVKQGLSEQGVDYRLSSPDEFGRFIENEIKRWTKVVKDNNIVATQ